MSWTTSTADLRTLLSDGATDKPRQRKAVLGQKDGVNTVFTTFEFRRITDLTTAVSPLGVYVNNVIQVVTADNPEFGQFTLTTAPGYNDRIEASYYAQWFTDAELSQFTNDASNWIGTGDITTTPIGLRPAALHYGAAEAYQKLSLRYAEFTSERFRLEDSPDKKLRSPIEDYLKLSEAFTKKAEALRAQYYTRQDQNLQPLFANTRVGVTDPQPKR